MMEEARKRRFRWSAKVKTDGLVALIAMEQSQRLRMWGCGSLWVGNSFNTLYVHHSGMINNIASLKVYCVTRVHGKI